MNHPSNTDIDKLRLLITQFDEIIFKLDPTSGTHINLKTTLAKIKNDVASLQNFAKGQAQFICSQTTDSYLKGVANSVFDSMSVEAALAGLRGSK